MEKRMLRLQELACEVGCSIQTLNGYFKFKKENPENELAMIIPDYIVVGNRHTRYWAPEAVDAIKAFRAALPQGRNGLLGSVTQRYVKSKKNATESKTGAKYLAEVQGILEANGVTSAVIEEVTELLMDDLKSRMLGKTA